MAARPDTRAILLSAAARLGFCAVAALLTVWGATPTGGSIFLDSVLYFVIPQAAVLLLDRRATRSVLVAAAAYAPVLFFACGYKLQHGKPSGIPVDRLIAVVVQGAYYPGAAVYLVVVYLERSVRIRWAGPRESQGPNPTQ